MSPTLNEIGLVLGTAFLAFLFTLGVRAVARHFGIVNEPNPIIPQHVESTAHLGGVAIGLALVSGLFLSSHLGFVVPEPVAAALLPGALFLAWGVLDDLHPLSAGTKLMGQVACAAVAVAAGLQANWTGIEGLDALFSGLFMVVVVNAVNVTDVCDGLVASLSLVTFLVFSYAAGPLFSMCLVAAGACLGFLALNRPPASIFLGDAGSHLLGFLLAVVGLVGVPGNLGVRAPVVAGCLVLVPVFELVFLTFVRLEKGLPWWKGSPDHFALRLQSRGLTRGQTDLWACTASLLGIGVAFALLDPASSVGWVLAVGLGVLALFVGVLLRRWDLPRSLSR